ncbi:MAG: hypothetical protein U0M13_02850 [Desulfovibrio fairfieldensis]|nr:hypothetical protein [Desulfovibrio fairfieldensis]
MLKHLRRWLGRGEPPAPDSAALAREEEFKARLRERCARFRRLLSANKSALEAMSDVANVEKKPNLEGNTMSCVLAPKKTGK